MADAEAHRCGHVAVVGRPNVGKSTLINRLLGIKVSITSRHPQTTRDRILGIKTLANAQIILIDTPGIHRTGARALNRHMNRAATAALEGVDLVLLVIEALHWGAGDEFILARLRALGIPVLLVVNKVDRVADKNRLLPFLAARSEACDFLEIIPLCARRERDVNRLCRRLIHHLPKAPAVYAEEEYTNHSVRFLCAEAVREKLIRQLGQEVPHRLAVEVTQFTHEQDCCRIEATVWVESKGQKNIVIGAKGAVLKQAGSEARRVMEGLLDSRVQLGLWVKVRDSWSNDEQFLGTLGYHDR